MRAVVYRGVNDLRLETVPVPHIGPGELLVKVAVCGVCPTDIKKIQHGTVPPPRIFGHETAGTIVRVGAKGGASVPASRLLTRFKVGDRVALHHHVPCLDCHFCRHRAFAQCETYKRTGITAGFEPAGGGYAEYVRVMPFVLPGVVKIPAQNSFAEGALLEPVNTVLKAVRRLNLLPGDIVWVAGQGPIGLMFTRLLQLAGARVIATDLLASRLKLARKFGAHWTLDPQSDLVGRSCRSAGTGRAELPLRRDKPQRVPLATLLRRVTRGRGLDASIIAVPSDAVVRQALQLVRGGGQVLLFAHTQRLSGRAELPLRLRSQAAEHRRPTAFSLDLSSICVDEKDLLGSYSSDVTLQDEVARLVFSRQLDVRQLITHRFPLDQAAAAVALAAKPSPDSLKIMVNPPAQPEAGSTARRRS
jgi:L-iditol 2-dehydrogenase